MGYPRWLTDTTGANGDRVAHLMTSHGPALCRSAVLTNRSGPAPEGAPVCERCVAALPDGVTLEDVT